MEQPVASLDSGTETAADESEDTSVDTAVETEVEDQSESSTEAAPPVDEEEIDYEGEKYKVPKKLKDAFMREKDYTQKTQSVAEQRKAVEAHAEQVRQNHEAQQKFIAEYAEVFALDTQLKQYEQLDWNALTDADPVQALKLDMQRRELQQRRANVAQSVTQKQQQHTLQVQQETAKRMQEGRAVLEREIKGWSPQLENEIMAYGKEIGFKDGELAGVNFSLGMKILHKAKQFDQLMKKQVTQKEKPETQDKPIPRIVASRGTATKDPSKMTDKEFDAMRRRQIAQR